MRKLNKQTGTGTMAREHLSLLPQLLFVSIAAGSTQKKKRKKKQYDHQHQGMMMMMTGEVIETHSNSHSLLRCQESAVTLYSSGCVAISSDRSSKKGT